MERTRFVTLGGISETWLNPHIINEHIVSETDYKFHRNDRDEQRGGGVLLLVKTTIKSERRKDLESQALNHNEIIVVEVEPSSQNKIAVVVAYRSQQDPYEHFLQNLDTALTNCIRNKLTNLLVIGDFNYSEIKWDATRDTNLPPHCREFLCTINRFGLNQLNHHASRRQTNNILDLILTNQTQRISEIYSDIFTYTSDHSLLHFDFNTTLDKIINSPRHVLNFKRANYLQLKLDINNGNLIGEIEANNNIDNKLTAWLTKVKGFIFANIPQITIKQGHSQPWIDHEALRHIRKKDTALRAAKYYKTRFHWDKFAQIRNRLKNMISTKHTQFLASMCNSITHNPKKFWTYLKTQTKSRGIPDYLKAPNGTKITDSTGMASNFNTYFHSTFTPAINQDPPIIDMHVDPNLSNVTFATRNE